MAHDERPLSMSPAGPRARQPIHPLNDTEESETEMAPRRSTKTNQSPALSRSSQSPNSSKLSTSVNSNRSFGSKSRNTEDRETSFNEDREEEEKEWSEDEESPERRAFKKQLRRNLKDYKSNKITNPYDKACSLLEALRADEESLYKPEKPKQPTSPKQRHINNESKKYSTFQLLSATSFVIAIIIGWFLYYGSNKTEKSSIPEDATRVPLKLMHGIEEVRSFFPSQKPSVWDDITVGIKDVMDNPKRPAIFLLLANENKTSNCLASKVGDMASRVLKGTGSGHRLTFKNLENNIGKVIENEEDKIREKKAVIIHELLMMHPEALKAFHFMCDQDNPLVAEAVYLITMTTENYKQSHHPVKFAEQHLNKTLSNVIEQDTLQPFIVRITGGAILQIQNEQTEQLHKINCD